MFRIFLFFLLTLLFSSLNAAVYKGQRVFVKECLPCHKDAHSLLVTKDAVAWEALMNKEGAGLAEVHLKDIKAEDSWKYFNGTSYIKKSKHLKQFLMEFAKDSGKVPALN